MHDKLCFFRSVYHSKLYFHPAAVAIATNQMYLYYGKVTKSGHT